MNKERKQARELLELEIKLARLKVTAAQIRQEKCGNNGGNSGWILCNWRKSPLRPLLKVGRRKPPFPPRAANPVGL